jgi:hypothetical protein
VIVFEGNETHYMKNSFIPVIAGAAVFLVVAVFFFKIFSAKPTMQTSPQSPAFESKDSKLTPQSSSTPSSKAKLPALKLLPGSAVSKSVAQENEIQKVRKELQAVMDLNKKISQMQAARSELLLRMEEKTLIQQKILEGIQKKTVKVSAVPTKEALLSQEKLRTIREEAMRSKKILDEVQTAQLR